MDFGALVPALPLIGLILLARLMSHRIRTGQVDPKRGRFALILMWSAVACGVVALVLRRFGDIRATQPEYCTTYDPANRLARPLIDGSHSTQ